MFDLEGLKAAKPRSISAFYEAIKTDALKICYKRKIIHSSEQVALIHFCIALFIEELKKDKQHPIDNPIGYFLRMVSNQSHYDVKQFHRFHNMFDSLDDEEPHHNMLQTESQELDYLWVLEQILQQLPDACQKILRPAIYGQNRSGVIDAIMDKLGFTRGSARVKKSFCEKKALELSMEFIKKNGLYE